MELHHFTARVFLPGIYSDGLRWGDTPTSQSEGINAVNLTSDHRAHTQAWTKGSTLNKGEIRLTVEISDDDPNLKKWSEFAKANVDPDFYQVLDKAARGKSDSWWIYLGVIPWSWVKSVQNTVTHQYLDVETINFTREEIAAAQELSAKAQQQIENLKEKLRKGR